MSAPAARNSLPPPTGDPIASAAQALGVKYLGAPAIADLDGVTADPRQPVDVANEFAQADLAVDAARTAPGPDPEKTLLGQKTAELASALLVGACDCVA